MFTIWKATLITPYDSPNGKYDENQIFRINQKRISISGVHEKFSVLLKKNKLRLIKEGEQGNYILMPFPMLLNAPIKCRLTNTSRCK